MSSEEFLFGGLRARLERRGAVRPRTIPQAAFGEQPEWMHAQVRFDRRVTPALRPRVVRARPVVVLR